MKKVFTLMAALAVALSGYSQDNQQTNQSWTLTSVASADVSNINADNNWMVDSKSRYCYTPAIDNAALTANGTELTTTKGLTFTASANTSGNIRLGGSTAALWLGNEVVMTIPNGKKGDVVTITYMTSKKSATRSLGLTNVSGTFPSTTGKTHQTGQGTITANGDVSFTITGGMYIYSLSVKDSTIAGKPSTGGDSGNTDNPNNPTDQTRGLDYTAATINTPAPLDSAVIWCSPDGNDTTADGTEEKPYFDVQNAIDRALPGTTIKMKAGTYAYNKRININNRNGRHDAYITVLCPDGRAILDFSSMPYHAHSDNPQQGIRLTSSYWHFYKIDITKASDNGMLIERAKPVGGSAADIINRTQDAHDNIIEYCNFYRNGDTGLQMKNLASYNYVRNCDSYENQDEGDGDADGFAPKISVGDGNYFFGCRAYNNSDDGYDVFFKKDGGFEDNKTIVFENCLAYENGFINGTATKGNMNGFKCGSKQGRMNVVLNRCLAVNNGSKGFDQNHNLGDIILNNCTGYSLHQFGEKAYSYRIYEPLASGSVCEVSNCIAINDYTLKTPNDKGEYGYKDKKYGRTAVTVASLDQTNDWTCSEKNFQSIADYDALIGARLDDGSLPWDNITWGHPTTDNAVVVDKGTILDPLTRYEAQGVKMPAIRYAGTAPDLGAFEQGLIAKGVSYGTADPTAIGTIKSIQTNGKRVSLVQAFNGMVIVNVNGAKASDKLNISAFSTDGRLLGQHAFNGTNTAITLPAVNGVVILNVKGNGVNETVKVLMK